jgi:hypothetical protein
MLRQNLRLRRPELYETMTASLKLGLHGTDLTII